MNKCPKCHRYSVSYDSYRMKSRCLATGCGYVPSDDWTEFRRLWKSFNLQDPEEIERETAEYLEERLKKVK